jgi:hypothetical protein
MGADWYVSIVVYGYLLRPAKMALNKSLRWDQLSQRSKFQFFQALQKIENKLPDPYFVCHMLPETHSRMEGYDRLEMIDSVVYTMGFIPSDNLTETALLAKDLERFFGSNRKLFSKVDVDPSMQFVAGVEWDCTDDVMEEGDGSEE